MSSSGVNTRSQTKRYVPKIRTKPVKRLHDSEPKRKKFKSAILFTFSLPPMRFTARIPNEYLEKDSLPIPIIRQYLSTAERQSLDATFARIGENGVYRKFGGNTFVYNFQNFKKLSDTTQREADFCFPVVNRIIHSFSYIDTMEIFSDVCSAYSNPIASSIIAEQSSVNRRAKDLAVSFMEIEADSAASVTKEHLKSCLKQIIKCLDSKDHSSYEDALIVKKTEASFSDEICAIITKLCPSAPQTKQFSLDYFYAPYYGKLDLIVNSVVVQLSLPEDEESEEGEEDDEGHSVIVEFKQTSSLQSPVPQALFGAFVYLTKIYLTLACEGVEQKIFTFCLAIGKEINLFRMEMDLQEKPGLVTKLLLKANSPKNITKIFYYVFGPQ